MVFNEWRAGFLQKKVVTGASCGSLVDRVSAGPVSQGQPGKGLAGDVQRLLGARAVQGIGRYADGRVTVGVSGCQ